MDNYQELTGIIPDNVPMRGDLIEMSILEGQIEMEVITATIELDSTSENSVL